MVPSHFLLLLSAGVLTASAQTLHLGTNIVTPGVVMSFNAPLNARASAEVNRLRVDARTVRAALLLPRQCTNLAKPCPLIMASVPSGGSAVRWMTTLTNVAMDEGWAVLAVDGPRISAENDTIQWGWAMTSSALDYFAQNWPMTKRWPVACIGFSGGAKRSAALAAAMTAEQWRVVGVFMGGCNEDRATLGQQLYHPGSRFKQLPFFLSNGDHDPIAGPEPGAAVLASMKRSGFVQVRLEIYPGKHELHHDHVRTALRWFLPPANGR